MQKLQGLMVELRNFAHCRVMTRRYPMRNLRSGLASGSSKIAKKHFSNQFFADKKDLYDFYERLHTYNFFDSTKFSEGISFPLILYDT